MIGNDASCPRPSPRLWDRAAPRLLSGSKSLIIVHLTISLGPYTGYRRAKSECWHSRRTLTRLPPADIQLQGRGTPPLRERVAILSQTATEARSIAPKAL